MIYCYCSEALKQIHDRNYVWQMLMGLKDCGLKNDALQEQMRRAGFEMNLVEDYCEHYCIIDRKVVWYGSMNFGGKEDAEDNLMCVVDAKIADELLEMTFGNERYQGEAICPYVVKSVRIMYTDN